MAPASGKIRVTLGLKADGPLPEPLRNSLGEVVCGPQGLLNLLETQLGIPGNEASFTTRLIQYLGCVDSAVQPDAFYSKSWDADPFSVARTLLLWRDQWYEAGWQGAFPVGVPARLADLAAIEVIARESVAPGIGQRIQRIIGLLADNPIAIESIALRDSLSDYPWLWQRLIEATGAELLHLPEVTPQADPSTDLGKLQRHLLNPIGQKLELEDDGTLVAIEADAACDTTSLITLLTRQHLSGKPDENLAILAELRGDLLDEAMECGGAPRLGFSALSIWRPVFQVLPLACELLWEPLNPTAMVQFLSHPVGPIPARQREVLARTAAEVPGIGSERWQDAVTECLEREPESERQRFADNIRYWLECPRYSPQEGVEGQVLADRAERVARWLTGAREACEDAALQSLYTIALNQAEEFVLAIERLREQGRNTLSRDNVLRLIEDVRGTGAPVVDREAQVCPDQPRAYPATHAGTFYTPMDRVIWWDCQAADSVRRWPWSRSERAALTANGVMLQGEDEQLSWLGKAWVRPILCATQQCLFVLHGDSDRHHPIWDHISSVTAKLEIAPATAPETMARLGLSYANMEPRSLPPKSRWWQLPPDLALTDRDYESYSSLDDYIHSPYKWLLKYAAKIRPGSLAAVNDGSLLNGNVAHRLYEHYFSEHDNIQAIDVGLVPAWVDAQMPTLLKCEGALLLEPGRQAECEHFIIVLQQSLVSLVEHLQQAGVISVSMEVHGEGIYTGGKLSGSIDLLATTGDGREAVIDIKWGSKNFRRDSMQEGSYLQLATYAQLRLAAGAPSFPMLSYFIVSDSHMLNLAHSFFPNAEVINPTTGENAAQYWARFEHTWRWRKAQFDSGLIEVTVNGTEPTENSEPGEAGLPMPETSDKFNDYQFITGWGENQ
ncbi:hypothetical protein E4634_16055 [Mangrovimicrobium sediminis]|uniref:PD-(D/E)XK endonuclease-like domain-containing protein n=1 Tax=Mangrovimicrobium sediminis TaxID=2562682 RepID=A0A4Z0LY59_9GAMM|nr:PD-(D/E)XK nuclease family protein [Haliea sp. SAOS-164]TGD72180.1 hypothetical protein E4634_16055 [Haliea sp. SAOS-164]